MENHAEVGIEYRECVPMANYYFTRGGQQFGPVSGTQLKQFAASGQIDRDDLVWREASGQRVPARKVQGLFAATPQPPCGKAPSSTYIPVADLPQAEIVSDVAEAMPAAQVPGGASSAENPFVFLKTPASRAARSSGSKSKSVFGEALDEIKQGIRGKSRKAQKTAIKVGIGCGAVLLALIALAILSAVLPSKEDITLKALVGFDGTQFSITNFDDHDWTSVTFHLNGVWGGYEYKCPRLESGYTLTVGVANFAKSDGTRFNPFTTKAQDLFFTAYTPKGQGSFLKNLN